MRIILSMTTLSQQDLTPIFTNNQKRYNRQKAEGTAVAPATTFRKILQRTLMTSVILVQILLLKLEP